MAMPRGDEPTERAPSPSSAAAFSFIMDKTHKARKEDRGWPNAEKCCLLVVSSNSQHDTVGLRLAS